MHDTRHNTSDASSFTAVEIRVIEKNTAVTVGEQQNKNTLVGLLLLLSKSHSHFRFPLGGMAATYH